MARTLDWKTSDDQRDLVHLMVQAIVEGHLVALPAETAYHVVASGLKPDAMDRLQHLAGDLLPSATPRRPYLLLRSAQEALDYSPRMSTVAKRMVNRGWPGPLVLELPVERESSLVASLSEEIQQRIVTPDAFLPQRVAAHQAITQAMRLLPGPLVALPIVDSLGKPACSAETAATVVAESVAVIVDDGPTHFGDLSTVVRVDGNTCQVVEQGVIEAAQLLRLGQFLVLLVCTGNTCRSPMAEVILRKLLNEKYPNILSGDQPAAVISSAGLSAFPGGPASPEALSVMHKRGLSLKDHQSNAVTERTLRQADLVLTMTRSHRNAIVERMPEIADKVHLLSGSNTDVSDPFGGSESVYMACADQIEGYLSNWIERLDDSVFPHWTG